MVQPAARLTQGRVGCVDYLNSTRDMDRARIAAFRKVPRVSALQFDGVAFSTPSWGATYQPVLPKIQWSKRSPAAPRDAFAQLKRAGLPQQAAPG